MRTLLALLLSSVSLSWVQPPNLGWGICGTGTSASPCLLDYVITNTTSDDTFTVPYPATSATVPADPGLNDFAIVLSGKNAAGAPVTSTPPATTTVNVPLPNVVDVCPPGVLNLPTGVIKPGGQSAIVSFSCPGAIQPASGVVGDSVVWTWATDPRTVTGWKPNAGGKLDVLSAVVANQVNFVLVNYTNQTFVVTPAQITVRVIR
jgi:hypothetical protein